MPLDFTNDDLVILENQRLERFRSHFAEPLSRCFIHIDRKNTLSIHCAEPWIVDQLLHEVEQISSQAYLIMGAHRLSICFAQEEIYATKTQVCSKRNAKARRSSIKSSTY